MAVGDISTRPNGTFEKVISETPIRNYCYETPEQEKARIKKGLPPPMYGYTAVKTEEVKGQAKNESEVNRLLKMSKEKRQEYYQDVLKKHGREVANELIAEVKKQRRLMARSESLSV